MVTCVLTLLHWCCHCILRCETETLFKQTTSERDTTNWNDLTIFAYIYEDILLNWTEFNIMEKETTFKVTPSPRKRFKTSEPTIGDRSETFFGPGVEIVENGTKKLQFKCLLCPKYIIGTQKSNLSSHLSHCHSDVYYTEVRSYGKEPLAMKRLMILLNAIEIVTINGRPFNALLDSGYLAGIKNKLRKLKDAGMPINFSNKNLSEIKKYLQNIGMKVRQKIQNEVKNRILTVMLDIATSNKRSIFGVSVQFIVGKRLVIRSLGLIELKQSHTGKYLAKVLFDYLQQFGIEKRQVISITTDNGKNVVKMVRDFDQINVNTAEEAESGLVRRSLLQEFDTISGDQPDKNTDVEIESVLAQLMSDEEALDTLFHEQQLLDDEDRLNTASTDFIGDGQIFNTTSHTPHNWLSKMESMRLLSATKM